jgi:hypothetical protein
MPLDFNPGSLLVTLGAIAVGLGLWWQFAQLDASTQSGFAASAGLEQLVR